MSFYSIIETEIISIEEKKVYYNILPHYSPTPPYRFFQKEKSISRDTYQILSYVYNLVNNLLKGKST